MNDAETIRIDENTAATHTLGQKEKTTAVAEECFGATVSALLVSVAAIALRRFEY